MQVVDNSVELRSILDSYKLQSKRVGFVPTMGALHQGHISLINRSKEENDITVCSIFVNPLQFNNTQDLKRYPRTIEADIELLESAGCDVLFVPQASTMYPQQPKIKIDFGELETVMEGKYRPGHFNGVAVVVAKLFHMVDPDQAYFGQKDLQQFLIIQQMVKDLSFKLKLICCDIIREEDGLAMSSRNRRLEPAQRKASVKLYEALKMAKQLLDSHQPAQVKQEVAGFLAAEEMIRLEYLEIADGETLETVGSVANHEKVAICIAAYLGEVRLIDNIIIEKKAKEPATEIPGFI
jgi:pantoate--beta-alanine ligase